MKSRIPSAMTFVLIAALLVAGCAAKQPAAAAPTRQPAMMMPTQSGGAAAPAQGATTALPDYTQDKPKPQAIKLAKPLQAVPFTLTDQTGAAYHYDPKDSRVTLLFFGYTNCADICSTTLHDFHQVAAKLGADAGKVRFVFVTTDPARDTVARLHSYLGDIDPRIVGLTGAMPDIKTVAGEFHIFFEQDPLQGAAADYSITHTDATFLVDHAGKVSVKLMAGMTPDEIAAAVRKLL